ncbi:hypothetical protein [Streptomyces lydicus]|uniref:hypothetical protein n=1 Tax=Streptomyces lydicus TaxID=47763 RepID=UPI0036E62EEB
MPPRKRAAAKPEETEDQQALGGQETGEHLPATPNGGTPNEETPGPEANAPSDPSDVESSGNPDEPKVPEDDDTPPETPTVQAGDQPCVACMPNGWPEGATAVGCTHGNWTRDA